MSLRFRPIIALTTFLIASIAMGQGRLFEWKSELVPADSRVGEAAQVVLTLTLKEGWHAYQIGQTGGPMGIGIELDPAGPLEQIDKVVVPKPAKKFDKGFKIEVGYYEKLAKFAIPVRIRDGKSGPQIANLRIKTQVCNLGTCDRPRDEQVSLTFTVASGEARVEHIAAVTVLPQQPPQPLAEAAVGPNPSAASQAPLSDFDRDLAARKSSGLFSFLLFCFGLGFVALLTPCVYPMIPITVSYFSKRSEASPGGNLKAAAVYGLGIILTFTLIGLLVTVLLGSNGTQILGANIWLNAGLILLFVALALSLFGVFEIVIPASILTKLNKTGRESGGVVGPLLLGLAFALTSFTCTVPIVGALLAGAASGDYLYPTLGMIAFSAAFALPFFVLALFPQFLKRLPKSGSWMTALKALLGFLEIAAALKFASNIDLVLHAGWLTRPVFLAIWAALFLIAGANLLGWVTLPHDSPGKIGWIRRTIGLATIGGACWFLWGINDNSMGRLNGFLPPARYPYLVSAGSVTGHGDLKWIVNDYDKALAEAKATGKPLFVDFTGYTCTNCRDMEANVFPRPAVQDSFRKMVLATIYVDEPGKELFKIQERLIKVSTLPSYVVIVPEGEKVIGISSWTDQPETFERFLHEKIAQAQGEIVAKN